MQEVCHDVALRPSNHWMVNCSQAMQMSPKKCVLISAPGGFWGDRFTRSLFDVRVFHPNAPSAITTSLCEPALQTRTQQETPSTSRESVRWKVQALCHWFSRPLEEWGLLVQLPSSVLPACSAESSTVSMPPC